MAIPIVLVLIVIGSVLFHFLSPWWITPLASNWDQMDNTLTITFVVTGIVFIGINLFIAYAVIRFRHREGRQAAYEPENKKLEWWLIGLTSIGIVIMLAPGLIVYAEFVHAPKEASVIEVVGQQWKWSFRFPGKDGVLGSVDPRLISFDNPFGLNADDPNGEDDVLVQNGELHLPLGQPVRVLLRSKDVLHDFYVPHFRVKMDAVPGVLSSLWFTPTRIGRFDIACAEFCGIGHHTMRGAVFVEEDSAFQQWLSAQTTFAQSSETVGDIGNPLAQKGRELAQTHGCLGCHSIDGSPGAGPTWQGLFGSTETLDDGSSVVVDEDYLKASIVRPSEAVVKGYPAIMPAYDLSSEELNALIEYTKTIQASAGR